MSISDIAYHERELRIALDPANPRRLVPDTGDAVSILDIGCGAGQTLIALASGKRRVGVDIDQEAIRIGSHWPAAENIVLAVSRGENLPFRAAMFDFVYSRVALPYMDVPSALAEMRRVLQKGGRLWLTLHPLSIPAAQFRRGNVKGKIHASYVVLNGFVLHFTGRTVPFLNGRCESFQTRRGMTVALRQAGFRDITFQKTASHFIVTAQG